MIPETLEAFSREYHDATIHGKTISIPLADSMNTGETTNEAAREFLADCGVTMTARFVGNQKHFDDDKQARDVWLVTIRRGRKSFTVRFGQSIVDSENGIPPCVVDVLCCLQKNDPGSLADWISEWAWKGADYLTVAEHRRMAAQWRAARREWRAVERVLGDCDLEWLDGIF